MQTDLSEIKIFEPFSVERLLIKRNLIKQILILYQTNAQYAFVFNYFLQVGLLELAQKLFLKVIEVLSKFHN